MRHDDYEDRVTGGKCKQCKRSLRLSVKKENWDVASHIYQFCTNDCFDAWVYAKTLSMRREIKPAPPKEHPLLEQAATMSLNQIRGNMLKLKAVKNIEKKVARRERSTEHEILDTKGNHESIERPRPLPHPANSRLVHSTVS